MLFDGLGRNAASTPDALFCGNDQIARGAIDALRERAIAVPDSVAVVGFDNWEIVAAATRPSLTSVDMNLVDLGRGTWGEIHPHRHGPDVQLVLPDHPQRRDHIFRAIQQPPLPPTNPEPTWRPFTWKDPDKLSAHNRSDHHRLTCRHPARRGAW